MSSFIWSLEKQIRFTTENCYSVKQSPVLVTPAGNSKVSHQSRLPRLLLTIRYIQASNYHKFHPHIVGQPTKDNSNSAYSHQAITLSQYDQRRLHKSPYHQFTAQRRGSILIDGLPPIPNLSTHIPCRDGPRWRGSRSCGRCQPAAGRSWTHQRRPSIRSGAPPSPTWWSLYKKPKPPTTRSEN